VRFREINITGPGCAEHRRDPPGPGRTRRFYCGHAMAALRRYRAIARGVYERVLLPPFGHWCSGGRYRAETTRRSRHGQPASGRCDPLTGDRHRVRELIGEWIVYPFGTRMRETHRSAGGAAPVSAIAAAPLAPRPRDNSREKRPHSLRSIAAEISDCCRQYHASFQQYHMSLSTGR